jgi:hypothetical protein
MDVRKTSVVLFLGIAAIVAGCTNRDKIRNTVDYDRLYFDYSISAEEDAGYVTCIFQYKDGDAEGKAKNIEPAKVELDGQQIIPDSAKLSGFFYEVQKPIDSFAGKHIIVLSTPGGKQYQNEFNFSAFELEEELPEKIGRKSFQIQLKNFPATEKSVRLLLLDTAFESSGFNDMVPVIDGKINVDPSILSDVKNGPIIFQLYMEQEVPLKQRTIAGGRISITYGLKRQFELVD